MKKIWNFIKEEDGLELSEYAIMGALLVIGLITAISTLGDEISAAFGRIGDEINQAGSF